MEAYTPREADEKELKVLSYVVGKNYKKCLTYEIEDLDGISPFPYFVVESGDATYDIRMMGLGELSLFLMLWELSRLNEHSVLLIEEPETHISPRSQEALMNVLAKLSLQKHAWVLLSTHSPNIVSRIPNSHIRLISRNDHGISIIDSPKQFELEAVLGIIPHYSGTLIVEDAVALAFLKTLLSFEAPELLRSFELIKAKSESDIKEILKRFPTTNWLTIVGIFDGDMRATVPGKDGEGKDKDPGFLWPYAFLPGEISPEELLIQAVEGRTEEFAVKLNVAREHLDVFLSAVAGRDSHDWLIELSKLLAISTEDLVKSLSAVWIEIPGNRELVRDLTSKLLGFKS